MVDIGKIDLGQGRGEALTTAIEVWEGSTIPTTHTCCHPFCPAGYHTFFQSIADLKGSRAKPESILRTLPPGTATVNLPLPAEVV